MTTTATRTVLRTEVRLFTREPASLFWIIVFPPLLLGVLGLVPDFQEPVPEFDGAPAIAAYVPVAVILAMIFASVSAIPVIVAGYREQRVLRRMATTPARASDLLLAQYVVHGAAAVVGALVAVLVARVAYDVPLPSNVPAWVLMFLLALAACLAIGGVVASACPTGKLATTLGTVLIFPLMFTAGVWIPVASMPDALQTVVSYTPLGAANLGLLDAGLGDWPELLHVGIVVGWTALLGAAAVRFFRWE